MLACVFLVMGSADRAWSAERVRFSRPDAPAIRQQVRDILADPRYAPRTSFSQWLSEKLRSFEGPDVHLGGFGRFLYWFIVVWMVLALFAILGHLAWTLWTLLGGFRGGRALTPSPVTGPDLPDLSRADLLGLMSELAARGSFREAIGAMVTALVRQLDESRILRFHESKTNGDYVREYPAERPGRGVFRQFVLASDRAVYGLGACDVETYEAMRSLFERVQTDASEPKI
jgi:hypothetical protein